MGELTDIEFGVLVQSVEEADRGDHFAGMLFRAVTADPSVAGARSLPDTGSFLSGGPIEISVDRPRQTSAGNWASIGITRNSRSAGQVW